MHLCLTISRFPAWIPKKTKFISNNKPEGQIEVGKTQTCNFQSQCEFYLSPFLVECLLQLYTQLISSGFTPFGEDRKHSFASQIACEFLRAQTINSHFPLPSHNSCHKTRQQRGKGKQTNKKTNYQRPTAIHTNSEDNLYITLLQHRAT